MRTQITNYIRAGYPGICLVSHEEQRVEGELKAVALKYRLFAWSATEGLVDTAGGSINEANDPMDAVTAVNELPENSVVLLRDFHLFMQDANPVLVRAIKDELGRCKAKGKCLIVPGCRQALPPEEETLNDIGGLGVLRDWLLTRKDAFGERARESGLPSPKGLQVGGLRKWSVGRCRMAT